MAPMCSQRRFAVAIAIVALAACDKSTQPSVPSLLTDLPALASASAARDSALRTLAQGLERWSAQAGRPMSAGAMIGPLLLRSGDRFHTTPAASDTGLEAEYQRLENRAAHFIQLNDSVGRAANEAHTQLEEFTAREATRAGTRADSFHVPIFPPPPNDSLGVARLSVKCALITVTVLPSKEGVRICTLKQKICSFAGPAMWMATCNYNCFDYIGWVPEGGGFTIGTK